MSSYLKGKSVPKEVPVLIVGGSLVGLSMSLLLRWHGIATLTVEHHRGTAIYPRAAQISQRTTEILRSLGLEEIVYRKSDEQFVQDGAIMAVETLAGREIEWYIPNLNEGVRDVSPSVRLFLTQSLLEPILRTRAVELGADIRYGTDLASFQSDGDGVSATIKDRESGQERTVRAQYLIAADGSRSSSREALGIAMRGRGVFSNSITIYFRANTAPLLRDRRLSVIYVYNSSLRGFFRLEKPFDSGFLAVNSVGEPSNPITDIVGEWVTEQRCTELVRTAIGVPDIPVKIENVLAWRATADVAERFQQGRVFLVGDAAHVMPPNGGFGGNTGVQDAHNLAWKLALVLKGMAGPGLLSTYELERRPAARLTVEQAYSRYVTRSAPYLGTDKIEPIVDDLNVELGYRYHSPAIQSEDPNDRAIHENPRQSQGRPGARAPHVFLTRNGDRISTLDLFGKNFVLLAGPDGATWCEGARDAAKQLKVAIDAYRIDAAGDVIDADRRFAGAYGITPGGAVLVRPDGFVAWRGRSAHEAPGRTLIEALSNLLCRDSGRRIG